MHYRHSFHAGNFADVFKHVVLCALLRALNRKDAPWCYVETHAGAGLYDLRAEGARRTEEWRGGIARVRQLAHAPELLAAYLEIVAKAQARASGPLYPGSPLFACACAREQDRVILCERVPEVAQSLRQALGADRRTTLHVRDGYESHALLPPKEKRGLVLVDPPFERPDEFDTVAEFTRKASGRFGNGIFALWYPIKNRFQAQRFERRIARECEQTVLALRFANGAPAEGQMRACGVAVLNAPYQLKEDLEPALDVLARELAQGPTAGYEIEELTPSA